jgi:MFS transporter, NNP family, nitrate/nitrite transporter
LAKGMIQRTDGIHFRRPANMTNEIQPQSPVSYQASFPLGPILFVTSIFYLTFVSRIILGPLLPLMERDMGWGHGEAGSLFIYIACGYSLGLLTAAYASSRLNSRSVLTLAAVTAGLSMMVVSFSTSVLTLRLCLTACGISSGMYVPTGIAVVTDLAGREHWGKATAVHELGPNLGYITGPFITEILIQFLPWRGVLGAVGGVSFLLGLIFFFFGRGGRQKGAAPDLKFLLGLVKNPSFWIMVVFFGLSVGASVGVYSLTPLFLISEAGFNHTSANIIIGLSRAFAVFVLFSAGMAVDRFGTRRATLFFLGAAGVFTLLIGVWQTSTGTVILIFLQAAFSACLFPVGFTTLAHLFQPPFRGAAISMVFFVCYPFAAGAIPSAIGHWAESFSFSSGFGILGVLFLLLLPLFLGRSGHFANSGGVITRK